MSEAPSHFIPFREPPRCMYPGELVATLWRHKHPRVHSLGIESNRWGDRVREDVGILPSGTVWVADDTEKNFLYVIPRNCIPYTSIRDSVFNPDTNRFEGEQVRGWRTLLGQLCGGGYLWPSAELSYLIGEDSRRAVPREYWT